MSCPDWVECQEDINKSRQNLGSRRYARGSGCLLSILEERMALDFTTGDELWMKERSTLLQSLASLFRFRPTQMMITNTTFKQKDGVRQRLITSLIFVID